MTNKTGFLLLTKIKLSAIIVFMLFSLSGCSDETSKSVMDGYQSEKTIKIRPTPNDIDDLDKAKEYLIGVWAFAEPLGTAEEILMGWQKIVVKENNTVDVYNSAPVNDDWGNASTYQYKIITGKYVDTGKRYYGLEIEELGKLIIDPEVNIIHEYIGTYERFLKRGDVNPFSK